ncbi:MAG: diguanylate cyclase, partial [Planctomycetota bacterium]
MSSKRISKERSSLPMLNYNMLREEGVAHLEALSSNVWSDYNIHDPGITILELLCYALTDLGYRASYPLADILAEGAEKSLSPSDQFFTCAEILTVNPVSENDYRKLLIDITGIRNAWLKKATVSYWVNCPKSKLAVTQEGDAKEVAVQGVYDVLLELDPDIKTIPAQKKIKEEAKSTLHAHRNLCEDFANIDTVAQQKFILCGEIDLTVDADVNTVQAEIFHAVQKVFTPPVAFYSFQEMIDRGKSVAEIYEGPELSRGFIDDVELERSTLAEKIRLSDLINVIMDIKGVKAIRDVLLAPLADGTVENKWNIPVKSSCQPVLSENESNIVYYKDFVPLRAEDEKVKTLLQTLRQGGQ